MSKENVTRRISIYVNGKEVENSLKAVDGAALRLRNQLRNLDLSTVEGKKKQQELSAEYEKAKTKQTEYREELGLTKKALDESAGSFSKLRDGLLSGDLASAKEGLLGLRGELTNLVKTSLAFIATPLGAAIAVLAGFAAGAKAIFNFNQEAEKSAVLIENLSGKTGQIVEDIRIKMQALTDTFGLTFDQLAGAVDNLVDTGVAKDELEALDKIKNGLLTAPDKNEFIASLESSALTAKQVGLSLEEVIALKKEIEETGVDPEATFGALQKAAKLLAEQSDSLRTKLSDALGAAFTDDILAKVKTGEITTVQALDAINKKSKEAGLNVTQQAELTKELFGKSGMAAGGFAVVLDTVTGGLKNQKEQLNGNQKALLDLADANEKLNKAQSDLFRVKDFGELWTGIKAKVADAFASFLTGIAEFKNNIQPIIDLVGVALVNAWIVLKLGVSNAFDVIGAAVKIVTDNIAFGFNFVKAIITGDFLGAIDLVKNYFVNLGNTVGNLFGNIKNNILNAIQGIVSNVAPLLDALGFDVDAIKNKLESLKSKDIVVKTTSQSGTDGKNPEAVTTKQTQEELDKQKVIRDTARQKEVAAQKVATDKKKIAEEKAAKEELDRVIALATAKQNLAKAELAFFIANERSKLDATKELTPEAIQEETDRLDRIKDRQLTALAEDRLAKVEKAERESKSAEELVALKQAIDYDYETNRQGLELGFQVSTDALKKQYIDEQKVLKAEQLLADNELALAEAGTKEEADAIKRQQDYAKELAGYAKLHADKKITDEEYERFKAAAKVKQDDMDRVAQIQKVQGTLGGLNQLAGAVTELFGQSKEMAIVQAGINGAMAVTSILAQYPKFDGGFAMTAALVSAGISTVAQIAKIVKAKPPKKPKFFYGGNTGSAPSLGYDEYGPMTGIVHKNEYVIPEVMTQSPRYANTIAWLEQERTGRVQKFATGGATSPGTMPSGVPGAVTDQSAMIYSAIMNLNTILANGITAKTVIGYQEANDIQTLNDERAQSTANGTLSE